ncbi:MAG TPA: hypothetical protein VLL52_17255 [Anaerolineae bacterium]|nr:hypothetical protein [Anaerolineae bacterium]
MMVVVGQAVAALEMTVARGLLCGSEVLVVAGQTVATLEMDLVGVLGIVRWAVAVGDMSYIG